MKMRKKGQVAIEYLLVFGFALLITIPLVIMYYGYTNETRYTIIENQLEVVSRKIVDSAQNMYYVGEPSKTTIKVFIPENVQGASIIENDVVFSIMTPGGLSEVSRTSQVNITGSLPSTKGVHNIIIEARGNYVWIGK